MTSGEANAVNVLLAAFLALKHATESVGMRMEAQFPAGTVLTDAVLQDYAILLADHAHKTLLAGVNGEQVRKLWNAKQKEKAN